MDGTPAAPPIELDTTEVDLDRDCDLTTRNNEQYLKHVPDIRTFDEAVFDWDSRSLVGRNIPIEDSESKEFEGLWFMYKCNESRHRLPLNKSALLDKMGKKYFGDVYLFRLEGEKRDQWGRAIYASRWKTPRLQNFIIILKLLVLCDDNKGNGEQELGGSAGLQVVCPIRRARSLC